MKWGVFLYTWVFFVKKVDLSPQNETKLNPTLLFYFTFYLFGGCVRTQRTTCLRAWVPTGDCYTDPFTTFTSPTGPFLSEWAKCQPGNTQNGGTVLQIANLVADSESGSPVSYSSFLVTVCLSCLVSEI